MLLCMLAISVMTWVNVFVVVVFADVVCRGMVLLLIPQLFVYRTLCHKKGSNEFVHSTFVLSTILPFITAHWP